MLGRYHAMEEMRNTYLSEKKEIERKFLAKINDFLTESYREFAMEKWNFSEDDVARVKLEMEIVDDDNRLFDVAVDGSVILRVERSKNPEAGPDDENETEIRRYDFARDKLLELTKHSSVGCEDLYFSVQDWMLDEIGLFYSYFEIEESEVCSGPLCIYEKSENFITSMPSHAMPFYKLVANEKLMENYTLIYGGYELTTDGTTSKIKKFLSVFSEEDKNTILDSYTKQEKLHYEIKKTSVSVTYEKQFGAWKCIKPHINCMIPTVVFVVPRDPEIGGSSTKISELKCSSVKDAEKCLAEIHEHFNQELPTWIIDDPLLEVHAFFNCNELVRDSVAKLKGGAKSFAFIVFRGSVVKSILIRY